MPVIGTGFLADNLTRSYPLAPFATKADRSGSFRLPDDFLASLYFPVGPELSIDPSLFFIRSIGVFAAGYSLTLGYWDGSADGLAVASANIAASAVRGSEFLPVTLRGVGDFSGSIGKLVVGLDDGIEAQPGGFFTFDLDATRLDVDCIRPQLRGVGSISILDGVDQGTPLYGDVQLVLGANIQFTNQGGALRIDAIQGAGLNPACSCGANPTAAPPITSINGIPADDGAFSLVAGDCIRITPQVAGLALADTCSSPCCGCAETATLQASQDFIMEQIKTLRDLINRVSAEVVKTTDVVIASKVSDTGCVSCS